MKPRFFAERVGKIGCAVGIESEGFLVLDDKKFSLHGFRVR